MKQKIINKRTGLFFVVFFIVFSFIFICPDNKEYRTSYHSMELKKNITKKDGYERIDYINEEGRLCIAADLGYATIVVIDEDRIKIESYYDDQGNPISKYPGCFAMLREYDDEGKTVRITYLDNNKKPINTFFEGYAIEERDYDSVPNGVVIRYYNSDREPVLTESYGYGQINEYYENGTIRKVVYIDKNDNPMISGQGYAIAFRQYYETKGPDNGKVKNEYYYDENNNPIMLGIGYYGMHKEYDDYGRISVIVYLDIDGKPIKTSKGYAKVTRTYHTNNTIATERYFDEEDNPLSLSEGQYGIKMDNGKTYYLNDKGKETINLRMLLYNYSWMVIITALIIIWLSYSCNKGMNSLLLLLYVITIMYLTIMFRDKENTRTAIDLFGSIKRMFYESEIRASVIRNIWLFIPLGAIFYKIHPHKIVLLFPLALSILIEVTQYIAKIGFCDFDDIICNGLGGWIGYYIQSMMKNMTKKR